MIIHLLKWIIQLIYINVLLLKVSFLKEVNYYYYYFHKLKNRGDSAIMLHDSVFFHKHIDFSNFTNYNFYGVLNIIDPDILTVSLLKKCKNSEKLNRFHIKKINGLVVQE